MGYEPLGCRVAVIPEDPGDMSSGGIVIPKPAQDNAVRSSGGGVVCGVGPMVHEAYCSVRKPDGTTRLVQPGDHVRYVTYSGTQFYNTNEVGWTSSRVEDGEKPPVLAVLNDQDILAIWVDEKREENGRDAGTTKKRTRKG